MLVEVHAVYTYKYIQLSPAQPSFPNGHNPAAEMISH